MDTAIRYGVRAVGDGVVEMFGQHQAKKVFARFAVWETPVIGSSMSAITNGTATPEVWQDLTDPVEWLSRVHSATHGAVTLAGGVLQDCLELLTDDERHTLRDYFVTSRVSAGEEVTKRLAEAGVK